MGRSAHGETSGSHLRWSAPYPDSHPGLSSFPRRSSTMVPLARRASLAFAFALLALVFASPANAASALSQNFDGGLGSWTTTGFWHVQSNPQNVTVKPEINPGLVTIPGGTLPPAFSGTNAAWFGEESNGTFCGPNWSAIQTP